MEAKGFLSRGNIDLVFLDIQMLKISGMAFLKSFTLKPLIIITTAFPNFVLEGFKLNVLDYLVKPITLERFLKSANRIRDILENKRQENEVPSANHIFLKCS